MSAFVGMTGRNVRIAVIDSGVHAGHPHITAGRLAGGIAITREGAIEDGPEATLDRIGHGTAVTAAIQEHARDAEIVTVRVFRDALRASAAALLAAIDWSVAAGVDIVNLSLGSTNAAHRDAFADAVNRATAKGVLLVAARSVEGAPCFPGSQQGVLGVDLDWDCPRGQYRAGALAGGCSFAAAGYPRPIEGVPPARNLYGVSFAVAQLTGISALARQKLSGDADAGAVSGADIIALLTAHAP